MNITYRRRNTHVMFVELQEEKEEEEEEDLLGKSMEDEVGQLLRATVQELEIALQVLSPI